MHAIFDVPAPAKLNLFLHVVGRRADGYHLLQSVFTLIDWCDTLHFERRADGRIQRHDLTDPLPAEDLCLRAARALQSASGCPLGVDISIDKQLPSGAGMGGGSSDAASTLLALNRLWRLNWPRASLQQIALPLGADVPFFVGGHNAWVEGIGERLTPIKLPEQWLAVVKPTASIPTAAIFASPLLVRNTEAATILGFLASDCSVLARGYGSNDLQPAAEAACGEVAEVSRWLTARFGNSRMTGSGSAVFARAGFRFDDAASGRGAERPPEAMLPQVLPAGWVGRMCRSLALHPLAGWAHDEAS
ncbi:MAG: 4-(cytidine 5'-diphospho)-2-C-methyl-D-erythritol kinase [Ideonella sp.]